MERTQGTYSLPLNSGAPIRSSAIMHPIDQTSTTQASVQSLCKRYYYTYLPCHIFCRRQLENSKMDLSSKVSPVCEHNLGCPVPSSCDIFRQVRSILVWHGVKTPTQAKITNFKFAIRVHEEVTRFEVPVYDSSRVDEFHSLSLIN
jgi:hypothetical protein